MFASENTVNSEMSQQQPKSLPPEKEPGSSAADSAPATNRVAEPVAAYQVQQQPLNARQSAPPTHVVSGHHVPSEVWQFAVANELLPHLETAVRLVYESFSVVSKIRFEHAIDPEIANNSWITIEVVVPGTVAEVLTQMNKFDREMISQVPVEKGARICLAVGGL